MAAYFFFDMLEVTDPAGLEKYREGVLEIVERFGGRYLSVGGRFDVVEGDWSPTFPVLIEFPSQEAARAWYDSEDYRELKALRLSATRGSGVFIEGNGFPA
ncbi:MAG: DUF1330 domain-containing protein [Pyrinomonadaceae bacterium]